MSPAPVLKDLETKQKAIELLASNPHQAEAAKALDVSEPTISRFKAKHQQEIQEQAERYLKALPSMIDQDIEEIADAKAISKNLRTKLLAGDTDNTQQLQKYLEYTDKKVTDIKRSIGMYSSHTPAMVFQSLNIYNDNRQVISPSVMTALTGGARNNTELPDDVVIDVDSVDK